MREKYRIIGRSVYDLDLGQIEIPGQIIYLSDRQTTVLNLLIKIPAKIITHKEIVKEIERVEGKSNPLKPSAIRQEILRLRVILDMCGGKIETDPKKGYHFSTSFSEELLSDQESEGEY